jgi:hypothetical protein
MALIQVNWNPSRRELRQFALLWIGFFGLVGLWVLWKGSSTTAVVFWVVATLGLAGSLWPRIMRPIYVVWMALALPIGWCVSHLLLLTVYYLVLTPIGLIMRWVGYDPLCRQLDRSAKTYWTQHDPGSEAARYFKQY